MSIARTIVCLAPLFLFLACGNDDGTTSSTNVAASTGTMSTTTGGGTTCADCTINEYCTTCNSANGPSYGCDPKAVVTGTQFACGDKGCSLNQEYCHVQKIGGDSCTPRYRCEPYPAACMPAMLNCACLEAEVTNAETCTDDGGGALSLDVAPSS
jgi:hypothetical protein